MDQENSVTAAISELQELERQRVADEAKKKQRERIESEKARALQPAEQECARRLAEEETRKRFVHDLRRRNAEVDAQIAALKAELAAVQAARQEIRLRLLAGYPTRITEIKSSRLGLKLACALAAGSAMTLLGVYSLSPLEPPANRSESERFERRDEASRGEQPDAEYPIVETEFNSVGRLPVPRPDKEERETPSSKKKNDKSQKHSNPRPEKINKTKPSSDILSDLDECGDDPTCGLPVTKNKRGIKRKQ